MLEGLYSLVEKSLLRGEEGPDREPRFSMLETIREYALERLEESEEAEEVRRRYAEYFVALAERVEPLLRTAEQETLARAPRRGLHEHRRRSRVVDRI